MLVVDLFELCLLIRGIIPGGVPWVFEPQLEIGYKVKSCPNCLVGCVDISFQYLPISSSFN